ncbi:hypothetical protein N8303_02210 [Gammaproteobacteria bacterium]|jgi:hypothetical protein|nr:hypothetical protein [Gammaproteobacteria bacterium]
MQKHHVNKLKTLWPLMFFSLVCFVQPVVNAQSDADIRESVGICQRVADLSYRLACYDRAFPPPAETANVDNSITSREEIPISGGMREQQRQLETERRQLEAERQRVEQFDSRAQIVEVQQPNLRTSRFITADGRVFIQSNATRVNRLPEMPFEVEIQSRLAGTTILIIQGPDGRDQRIRVLLED